MARNATREVRVYVKASDTAGLKRIQDELFKMNKEMANSAKAAQNTAGFFSNLQNVLLGFAGFQGVSLFGRTIDELTLLEGRIRILSKEGTNSKKVMEQLAGIAIGTRSDLEGTATAYNRLALAMKQTGISSEATLAMVTSLQNTFRLSGSTLAESTNTLIQLSQGMQAGALRGEELRAVLEQNGMLTALITERFKELNPQLRNINIKKFAEEGKITSKFIAEVLLKNFDQLLAKAQSLPQTFEQTLAKAFIRVKFAMLELSNEFDLHGKFAKGVEWITKNTWLLSGALGILASVILGKVITSIVSLSIAFTTMSTANIAGIILTIASSMYILSKSGEDTQLSFQKSFAEFRGFVDFLGLTLVDKLREGVIRISAFFKELWVDVKSFFKKVSVWGETGPVDEMATKQKIAGIEAENAAKKQDILKETNDKLAQSVLNSAKAQEFQNRMMADAENAEVGLQKIREKTGDKFSIEMAKQKKALQEFLDLYEGGLLDTRGKKTGKYLEANQALIISSNLYMGEYLRTVDSVDQKYSELFDNFRLGRISLTEFNKGLLATKTTITDLDTGVIFAGVDDYLRKTGTLAQGIAGVITSTFGHLEDVLVEFTKTGRFEFDKMTRAILDDLNRIIIRSLIIRPLASAILSGIGPSTQAGSSVGTSRGDEYANADGGVYGQYGRMEKFAKGGLVNEPTMFKFAKGTGLMGEAGPEAIMPLKRDNQGRLGVIAEKEQTPVVVNVVNQTQDSESKTSEREGPNGTKIIDILIVNKTKEAFNSGSFDAVLATNFGVRRRGV